MLQASEFDFKHFAQHLFVVSLLSFFPVRHQMKDTKPYQVLVQRYTTYKRRRAFKDRKCLVCDKTFARHSGLVSHYNSTIHKEKVTELDGNDELDSDDKQRKSDHGEAPSDLERRK